MVKLLKDQKGEVATVLTIVALGIMTLGSLLGGLIAQRKEPLKVSSRAEEIQPTLEKRCIVYNRDGEVLEAEGYDSLTAGYIKYYDINRGGEIRRWDDRCIGSGVSVRLHKYYCEGEGAQAEAKSADVNCQSEYGTNCIDGACQAPGGGLEATTTPSPTATQTPTPTFSPELTPTVTPDIDITPTSTPVPTPTPTPERISCKIEAVRQEKDASGNQRVRVVASTDQSEATWLQLYMSSVSRGNAGWGDYLFNPNSCTGRICTINGGAPANVNTIAPGDYWIVCNAGNGTWLDAPDMTRKCGGNPFGTSPGWEDCGDQARRLVTFRPNPTPTPVSLAQPTNVEASEDRMGESGEIPVCGKIKIEWRYDGEPVDYWDLRFYSGSNERLTFRLAGRDADRDGNKYSYTTQTCFFLAPSDYNDVDPDARVSITAVKGSAQSEEGMSGRFSVSAMSRQVPHNSGYFPCQEQCGQFDNRTLCTNQGGYCSYQGNCPAGEEWLMWCGRVGGTDYGACCRTVPEPTATPTPTPTPTPEVVALSGVVTVTIQGDITVEEVKINYEDIFYPIPQAASKRIQAIQGSQTFTITSADSNSVPIINNHQYRLSASASDSNGKSYVSTSIATVTAPASGIELTIEVSPAPTLPAGNGIISGRVTVVGKPPGINLDIVRLWYEIPGITDSARFFDLDVSQETQQYEITGLATGIEYGIRVFAATKTGRTADNRPEDCEVLKGFPPMECLVVPSPSATQDFSIILPPDPTPVYACEEDNEISGRVQFNGIPDHVNYRTNVMVLYPVQMQSSDLHELDYRFLVEPERMWMLAASIWKRYMRNGEESWAEYQRFPLDTYPVPPPQCELFHSVDYLPPPDDCTEPNCPAVLEFLRHVFDTYNICSPVQEQVLECGVVPLIGSGGIASCPIAMRLYDGVAVHEFIHIWQAHGGMSNPVSFVQEVAAYACQNGINNQYLEHFPQDCQNFCDFSIDCAERAGWGELQAFIGDDVAAGGSDLFDAVKDYYNGFFCGDGGGMAAKEAEKLGILSSLNIDERTHSLFRISPTFILLDRAQQEGRIPDEESAVVLGNVFTLFGGEGNPSGQTQPYEKPEELATIKATAPDGTVLEAETDYNGSYILRLPTDVAGRDYGFSFTSRYGRELYHDIKQTIYPEVYYNISAQIGLADWLGAESEDIDIPQIILPVRLSKGENLITLPFHLQNVVPFVDFASQITAQGGEISQDRVEANLKKPFVIQSDTDKTIFITLPVRSKDSRISPNLRELLKSVDINRDGVLNTADLSKFIINYGAEGTNLIEDLDGNGKVNALDFSRFLRLLITHYGQKTKKS